MKPPSLAGPSFPVNTLLSLIIVVHRLIYHPPGLGSQPSRWHPQVTAHRAGVITLRPRGQGGWLRLLGGQAVAQGLDPSVGAEDVRLPAVVRRAGR